MAYFAQLDENNVVLQVVSVVNDVIMDESGGEQEAIGISFCKDLYGQDTNWVQTSFNSTIRVHFASAGYTYDPLNDRFVPPQPYPSWILDETINWVPPVPYPTDGGTYDWDEATQSFVKPTNLINVKSQGTQEF